MAALLALLHLDQEIVRVDTDAGTWDTVLNGTGDGPDGIAVDGDTIYFTTMGAAKRSEEDSDGDYSAHDGGVHMVRGGDITHIVASDDTSMVTGKQVVVGGNGRIYWADREGHAVWSASTDGTDVRVEVSTDEASGRLAEPVGVVVDADNGYLYWTEKGPSNGGVGRIYRAGLLRPADTTPENREDVEMLIDALPEPIDLELHDGYLYWSDRGDIPGGNTLNRAPVPAAGEKMQRPEILAEGFFQAIGLAIDPVEQAVYVADLAGDIRRVTIPAAGEEPEVTVVAKLGVPVTGIALA